MISFIKENIPNLGQLNTKSTTNQALRTLNEPFMRYRNGTLSKLVKRSEKLYPNGFWSRINSG
jgi:hypothetical protein